MYPEASLGWGKVFTRPPPALPPEGPANPGGVLELSEGEMAGEQGVTQRYKHMLSTYRILGSILHIEKKPVKDKTNFKKLKNTKNTSF